MTKLGDHLLGRIRPPDERHVQLYPFATAPPPHGLEIELKRPAHVYDQGATPRCVGFSTSKVASFFNGYVFDADWLYDECKKIDAWPGADGTSARYACDVLRREGHLRMLSGKDVKAGPSAKHGISGNSWALNVNDIRAAFTLPKPQPVLLGIDWHEAWFRPEKHTLAGHTQPEWWLQAIPDAGPVAGGHEIGIWAVSDKRSAFAVSNTWGSSWPDLAWVSFDTVAALLAAGGDACVMHDLATR